MKDILQIIREEIKGIATKVDTIENKLIEIVQEVAYLRGLITSNSSPNPKKYLDPRFLLFLTTIALTLIALASVGLNIDKFLKILHF